MADTPRIAELRKKIEKDPGSRLFAQLAEELRKEGEFAEAIAVARKGLDKHANYPSARLTMGRALLDSGRPADAKIELEQVVKASPDNILASKLLGDAFDDLGESAKALEQFERTLKLSPGDRGLLDRMGEVKLKLRAATFVAPEAPAALPALEMPPTPAAAVPGEALDRDLASGTLTPGAFQASDLAGFHDPALVAPGPPPAVVPPAPPAIDVDATVGFGELQRLAEPPPAIPAGEAPKVARAPVPEQPVVSGPTEAPPVVPPAPSIEDPAPDPGAQTIPLTSVTLADLYLQQGLKAEANEVLNQVLKAEPGNAEALSRLAQVSAPSLPVIPPVPAPPPPLPSAPADSAARPRRNVKDTRESTIASLTAFMDATEREAAQQRATPQGQGTFQ